MSRRFDLTNPDLTDLLRWMQDGVVSRQQLLALGATDNDIRRMVRRKELTRAHPGVFVNHTGQLNRQQREWVAVLAAWPAALARESALPIAQNGVIHIAVDQRRDVQVPDRVVIHRTKHLDQRADLSRRPPCVHLEHALIDVMAARLAGDNVPAAFRVLTEVAHTRRTNPERLLSTLDARHRVPHRTTIRALLIDLRDGACSVLERGYLHRVERAHGLPRGSRQHTSRATGNRTDKDVRYDDYGVIVELDGRAFHDNPLARDDDARRDLAELATADAVTARVTYGLVFRDTCRTAAWVARVLHRHGWRGPFRRCAACPR